MSQQNSSNPGTSKMSEAELLEKLKSRNPITQVKLLAYNIKQYRLENAGKVKQSNGFRVGGLIFGVAVVFWATYARSNVMHLKNNDYGVYLADQEVKRMVNSGQ